MNDVYEMLRRNINPIYVDVLGSESWERQFFLDELEARDRRIAKLEKANNILSAHIKLLKEAK